MPLGVSKGVSWVDLAHGEIEWEWCGEPRTLVENHGHSGFYLEGV